MWYVEHPKLDLLPHGLNANDGACHSQHASGVIGMGWAHQSKHCSTQHAMLELLPCGLHVNVSHALWYAKHATLNLLPHICTITLAYDMHARYARWCVPGSSADMKLATGAIDSCRTRGLTNPTRQTRALVGGHRLVL